MTDNSSEVPPFLTRYYSFNLNSLNSLRDLSLFYSHRKHFNDPFDSKYFLSDFSMTAKDKQVMLKNIMRNERETLEDIQKNGDASTTERLIQERFDFYIKPAVETFQDYADKHGYACLSARHDSSLMWSHYAESHKGFCIEFDTQQTIIEDSFIHPITYPKPSKRIKITGVPELVEHWSDSLDLEVQSKVIKIILQKNKDWSYEEEWRFVIDLPDTSEKYNPQSLKNIYFGMRSELSNQKLVYSILKYNNLTPNFFQADYHPDDREKMIFKPINLETLAD